MEEEISRNIVVTPSQPIVGKEFEPSCLNQTSMVTYSKIVCCLCSQVIEANPTGICDACRRKSLKIAAELVKEYTLNYCRTCDRYLRPPWMKIDLESKEMMYLCLSRVKGLKKRAEEAAIKLGKKNNEWYTNPYYLTFLALGGLLIYVIVMLFINKAPPLNKTPVIDLKKIEEHN